MKLKPILILVAVCAVLGIVFLVVKQPVETEEETITTYIWDFDMDDLEHITITLPKSGESMSWVMHSDRYFYFDVEDGCQVDMDRWGGGIPLILSGPGAQRIIGQALGETQLAQYGFDEPTIEIELTLSNQEVYNVVVGDSIPSGQGYYIKMAEYRDVYTVDYSWYDVISALVTDPPYTEATIAAQEITISPEQPRTNQTITINVLMANTGCLSGSYDVVLKINNIAEGEPQTITLEGNSTQMVTFTTVKKEAGIYSVTAGGKSARLEVK